MNLDCTVLESSWNRLDGVVCIAVENERHHYRISSHWSDSGGYEMPRMVYSFGGTVDVGCDGTLLYLIYNTYLRTFAN